MRYCVMVLLLIWPLAVSALPLEAPLANPQDEARARAIFKQLRCVVCQSESIDDSNATLAADLRTLVRARVEQGEANEAVISYVVSRYGDYVLLSPPFASNTYLLWVGPLIMLIIGGIIIGRNLRQQKNL